ncbi:TonB-dependent receptor [Sphingobacterium hotanense]|uniref:TonB-dependent receptor n=1 Tax=Sphingobacterium hotanense TaxID=649196 RepID=UPI0021A91A21|nr:TonB-dependent receptor [Sphingobacterium hotanense]MCT1524106.1 TonB-dependent receptor [Sphingobacterium hotanense]
MQKTLLLFSLLLLTAIAHAQNSKLSGTIQDSLSKQPLAYVSIAVIDDKNQIVEGQMTDANGRFVFAKLNAQQYSLQVKSLGYKQRQLAIDLNGQKQVNLQPILLSADSETLETVHIEGQTAAQKHSADRQVYQANQYKNAVGGTALDIVKNLPAAAVDAAGNISVRGNSGILVLVNGKPSLVDPATILTQIAANDVSEVEYISSPTAQYDPDGKGGIINIKTKKSVGSGFAWVMNLQGGLPSIDDYDNLKKQQRYGADVAFQYRKDKLELSASANYLRNDNAGFRDGDVNTIIGDKQTFFPSKGERSFDKYNYGLRLNAGYELNDRHQLSLGALASRRFQDRVADIYYNNRSIVPSTGETISTLDYFNPNLQNKQGKFYLLDLAYTWKINPAHSLQLGAIYEYADIYGSTNNNNIENQIDTIQRTYNKYTNPLKGLRLSANHQWSIGNAKINSGYQLRRDEQDGNFEYYAAEGNQRDLSLIPEFSGQMKASNTVHAVYSQYDQKFEKLSLSLGLRYEYYQRDLILLHTQESFPYSIHQLYPSINLMRDLGEGWSWKMAASRRVQRNNNFELNPIPEREHSETLEQGDPELLPEFISQAEAGLVKKLNKGSLFMNAYFQHSKNPIQRVNSVYADTILHRVFTNADYANRLGVELGGEGKLFQWLQINGGINLYNYKITGKVLDYDQVRSNQDWVYSINAGVQASLPNNWSTGLQVNYLSERPTVQGVDSRFLTPNFNLSKSFWKGAMTAQLQWQFIELGKWGVNEQRITTSAPDFHTTTNYIYEKNVFLLNLNINLQRLNQVLKLPKSEFGEKEF